MFYAEKLGDPDKGEPYIADRGVFMSIAEFAPYREKGWSGSPDNDFLADKFIVENLACESLEDMGLEEAFEEMAAED